MAELTEPTAVRRLCERDGFALGGDRLAAAQAEGFDATLDRLLTTSAPDPGATRTPAEPSLTDLDDGDLKAGVDFRAVYAMLLEGVLGADPARILPGFRGSVERLLV